MTYPDLTICICTYKRPWYAILTLNQCKQIRYAGKINFHIAKGGSKSEDLQYYKLILKDYETTIGVTNNLSDMVNSCAHNSGEVWIVGLDDFTPRRSFDVTPDVQLLLEHPEIGCVRYSRLAFFGSGGGQPETSADMVTINGGGQYWWRFDKARTKDSYSCNIGFHLYHRRFWDCYGDISACPPDHPGKAEHLGMERYNNKPDGVTIAIPMRFPQDSVDGDEFIWHLGMWRTDEYLKHSTTGRL